MLDVAQVISKPEFEQFSIEDRVKFLKYCYGQDVKNVEDAVYERIKDQLPTESPVRYLDWNDVEYADIEHMLGVLDVQFNDSGDLITTEDKEPYLYLQDLWGKNHSITMIEQTDEVKEILHGMYNVLSRKGVKDLAEQIVFSLKYDGWNITTYYVPESEKPVLIHTRARTGKAIYCTKLLQDWMPKMKVTEPTRVVGELCLDEDALVILKEVYPNADCGFVSTRTSVTSIVHGTINIDLIKDKIYYFAFALQTVNGNVCKDFMSTLELLDQKGFTTPYWAVIDNENEYDEALAYMTAYYKELEPHVKCDGVVMEPNSFEIQKECNDFVAGDNQAGLVAIKADYWFKKTYEGVVTDIVVTQTKYNRVPIAIIEPVQVASGAMVSRVPLLNCRTAHAYGKYVDVGDHILFTFHSQQIVHFDGFATLKASEEVVQPWS